MICGSGNYTHFKEGQQKFCAVGGFQEPKGGIWEGRESEKPTELCIFSGNSHSLFETLANINQNS